MAKGPNPAMRAKRVHGPSAQRILLTHVACERCHVKGCNEPVLVTRNPNRHEKHRACELHFTKARTVKPELVYYH